MSKFNASNKGHREGYPLFLGEDLGVLDTINVQYPQLEQLYQDQIAQLWNEFEVDLTQDKMDMRQLDKGTVDLMVKTIMWQTVADSVASRSIIETLGQYITNSELMNLATVWSFFEVIHARTYSHIIKQTFTNPNELLEEIYEDSKVLQRSDVIVEAFDNLASVDSTDEEAVRKAILMAFVALFALEAIAFMASFAVTFSITEQKKFQGIGKLVTLICRDEVLHTRMDYTILDIMKKDATWRDTIADSTDDISELLNTVVANELVWADYVFSEGRQVVGLNAELLKEYVMYMAAPVYGTLGIDTERAKENPLPYMEKYIDTSKMQTANMELQNSSYLIGTIEDDTNDLDFGEFL
jgi:ribonucleoside-diphosphate reductase beta chain